MASVASPLVLRSRIRSPHLFPATAVSLGQPHGHGVLLRIGQISGGAFPVQQEVLYPALYHVEHQRVITSEWGMSDNHPRAKFYRLTAAGRRWLAEAMARALAASPAEVT